MQHEEMHIFQINTLFSFSIMNAVCMFRTLRIHSQTGLKHVVDVKHWKIELKYEFKSVHFICLCCIIISQRTVQKKKHKYQLKVYSVQSEHDKYFIINL